MKKILLTLLMLQVLGFAPAFAENEEELVPVKSTTANSDQLVNTESRRMASKIDDVERRLKDLERSQRSLDERVRSMERSVSDLRRSAL